MPKPAGSFFTSASTAAIAWPVLACGPVCAVISMASVRLKRSICGGPKVHLPVAKAENGTISPS